MDLAGLIGRGNALPWRLPADMKHFRALTLGTAVVMGRRTFESIGKPLAKRTNLVLSSDATFAPAGCECFRSLEDAIVRVGDLGVDAMVIGGARVYQAALPVAGALELTVVGARFEGDVWFPPVPRDEWQRVSHAANAIDEENRWPFTFVRLARSAPAGTGGAPIDWSTLAH